MALSPRSFAVMMATIVLPCCLAHPLFSATLQTPRKTFPKRRNSVEKIRVTGIDSAAVEAEWRQAFGNQDHELYSYDANKEPTKCLGVIRDSYCFWIDKLPPALIHKLMAFSEDPQAPSALLVSGLPIDANVPPTPKNPKQTIGARQTLCPVAETLVLGISRLMGTPHCPPAPFSTGLVRDIVPKSAQELDELPMHRDFPAQSTGNGWEPQMFCLLCVRGDPAGCAAVVTDCKTLLRSLSQRDVELLSQHPIQAQLRNPAAAPDDDNQDHHWIDVGDAFSAIEPDLDLVTLFGFPGSRHVSPTGGQPVEEAYQRLAHLARKLGQTIVLKPGDLLVVNNAKCVHGRTRYQPLMDGTDRWLLKNYVSSGVWNRPATRHEGLADYPQMELGVSNLFRKDARG